MGAGFSGLVNNNSVIEYPSKPGLGDLPESCIALVLSRLDPSEICKLACVNNTFREASLSDVVWESKLPENHHILVKKLFGVACLKALSKKEIFDRLSHPIRFAADTKEVWLDKSRGGVSVAISWKGLKITGIDDRRYWTHISSHESRFQTIAYLQQIWWLEIEGKLEFEFPVGTYSVFFRLHLGRASKGLGGRRIICDAEKIHGWDIKPVKFQLESSNGHHAISQCFLDGQGKWLHHHVGDFVVENSSIPTTLKFSMAQIDCTHTKGGLCLDSVFIFPSRQSRN
ncbi:hypothetical protein DH2020_010013 [Rehmannia glutinosa]|uniref:F-box domain-containing protein n=1 Tax=Rehmannia glutinosa TaxID=99300 RepID=A0ABR0X8H9_REHGL